MLNIFPIPGLPEIKPGDDLAELIFQSCKNTQIEILDGDVLVVTQKIVSKAEDRLVEIDPEIGHKPLVEEESVPDFATRVS